MRNRLAGALAEMARLHADQTRKDGRPTIGHILAVTSLVLEHDADEDQAIAAVFHDTLEDCGRDLRSGLAERYGDRVVMIVDACTDPEFTAPRPPWRKRKEIYLQQIRDADPAAHLVAASDKLANARVILADYRQVGPQVWERVKGDRDDRRWYLEACADLARDTAPQRLADELTTTTREILSLDNSHFPAIQ